MPSAKYDDDNVSLISRDWGYRPRGPLNTDLKIMHGTNLSNMHKYYNLTANVKLYSAVSLSSWQICIRETLHVMEQDGTCVQKSPPSMGPVVKKPDGLAFMNPCIVI